MPGPIVYVGKYKVLEGKLEEFKQVEREVAEFVEANEPQLVAYTMYVSDDGKEATGIQIHPTSESMETHLKSPGPSLARRWSSSKTSESISMERQAHACESAWSRWPRCPESP